MVEPGAPATLQWILEDATSVLIKQGIGKVGAVGSLAVKPLAPTT